MKFIIPFLLAVLLFACQENNAPETLVRQEQPVSVFTMKVEPRRVNRDHRFFARTEPFSEIALMFKGSGRIRTLHFEEGARVKKDQLLGSLVEEDYESYRRLARIQVRTLEPDARRLQKLAEQEALPAAEAERMQGKVDVAKAQLRQADAAYSGIHLRAPADGFIEKKLVSVGDLVSPAREVARLLDLSRVQVVIPASEQELSILKPQTPVQLEFQDPPRKFASTVHRIAPLAEFKTRTFAVTILLDNEFEGNEPVFRAGMPVTVKVEHIGEDTLWVPFSSVLRDTDGRTFVYLSREGRAARVFVRTGELFDGQLRVIEGLASGDELITTGQHFLRPGTPLLIQ